MCNTIEHRKLAIGGGKRQSNIELLRIVSMLLVLLIHYTNVYPFTPETVSSAPLPTFLHIELKSLSSVCVNCFILISGYFGIRWRAKSIVSLIFQILFWLFVGSLLASFLGIAYHDVFFKVVVSYFGARWFVPAYIGLYIIAPVLNKFIESCSVSELGRYILIFYLWSTIIGYLCVSYEFNEGMSIISLVGLYMIGNYVGRTQVRIFNLSSGANLVIYLGLSLVMSIGYFLALCLGINKCPIGYLNPVVILMSVYLFLFFKRLSLGQLKFVNYIAVSAFAVYLFHMHPAMQSEYYGLCHSLANHGFMAFLMVPMFFVAVFAFCILVDRVRLFLFNLIWAIRKK